MWANDIDTARVRRRASTRIEAASPARTVLEELDR